MFSYSNTSLFEYCRPLDEEVQRVQGAADCVPILLKAVGLRFEEELLKGAVEFPDGFLLIDALIALQAFYHRIPGRRDRLGKRRLSATSASARRDRPPEA